ncbi:MAG: Re/Si-specific NAD(P)(+) transhydrogenase subunit alpha [Actinomycetaceae bacterium]|nr:Re/Si-specific NAD(P)(+) transhydrogenase subunit alpha [Actinomycetaceae bacterium]
MQIGVPKEPSEGQTLVAASPDTVGKLIKLGYQVCVETGAGVAASYLDEQYQAAGAEIVDRDRAWAADIVTCLDAPPDDELALMREGATLIARLDPGSHPERLEKFSQRGITALSIDAVPRISRAQSMDVRSSMANIGGYRAVIEAANRFGRLFTGQVTAAGKVPPATVYVIGVGVAGLSAIGTANSLGAIVKATDVRPETAEQVHSMGGEFVAIPVQQESTDGYAKAMTADQEQLAMKVYAEQAASSDIVITTAAIPGRAAPRLLTAQAIAAMKPGSVIVDMAASTGGNCELTVPGEVVQTDNGVTIIGYLDLPRRLPGQASQLYGQNIVNFFKLATPQRDGQLTLDEDDVVVRSMTVTLNGHIMWPPPPVKVSAAPPPAPKKEAVAPEPEPEKPAWRRWWWRIAAVAVFVWLILTAPYGMRSHFIVFALAIVVGFYVITNVTHALHTPLMSVTNAISGIIVVGAIQQIGSSSAAITVLAFIAMSVAFINVFGGFTVTHRMLKMFRRS